VRGKRKSGKEMVESGTKKIKRRKEKASNRVKFLKSGATKAYKYEQEKGYCLRRVRYTLNYNGYGVFSDQI
jgi:hypothetical protein